MSISEYLSRYRPLEELTPLEEEPEGSYVNLVPALTDVPDSVLLSDLYQDSRYQNSRHELKRRLEEAGLGVWQRNIVLGALGHLARAFRSKDQQPTMGDMRSNTDENWQKIATFSPWLGSRRINILRRLFTSNFLD